MKTYAETSLVSSLARHGQTVALGDPDQTQHPLLRGHDICLATGGNYLVFGSLTTKNVDPTTGNDIWTGAYLNLTVYDCGARKLEQVPKPPLYGGAFSWKTAVGKAADAAVATYLLKVSTLART